MELALLVVVIAVGLGCLVLAWAVYRRVSTPSVPAELEAVLREISGQVTRLEEDLRRVEAAGRAEGASQRQELAGQMIAQRGELGDRIAKLETGLSQALGLLSSTIGKQVEQLAAGVHAAAERQGSALEGLQRMQQQASTATQGTLSAELGKTRGEITGAVDTLRKENSANLSGIAERVTGQLARQAEETGTNVEKLRSTVEMKLTSIQTAADAKLEQMRATVDEKLTSTLSTRLGESFKQVSERLEAVHAGLGEMRSLAGNVTDLRRVMTNVKTRGVWGELQLGNLLEQLFTPEQYEANFKPRPRSGEIVEFALKLPGPEDKPVYLPIDSKFPIEDFQRLVEASEAGDADAVAVARKALENSIYRCARDIRDKYVAPPVTTPFAVLFLPLESLYAEVLRIPGLLETLNREYRVIVQGPSGFSGCAMAFLMGFRTLAIQKRSLEIGNLLGAIKTDFGKFSELLGKVEEKLDDAKGNIQKARQRSTQIVKKLGKVEALPQEEAGKLLPEGDAEGVVEE